MRLRIAEIGEHPIAHILGDEAIEAPDDISDGAMVCSVDLAQILRIAPKRAFPLWLPRPVSPETAQVKMTYLLRVFQ